MYALVNISEYKVMNFKKSSFLFTIGQGLGLSFENLICPKIRKKIPKKKQIFFHSTLQFLQFTFTKRF